jgi:hypothetical protein
MSWLAGFGLVAAGQAGEFVFSKLFFYIAQVLFNHFTVLNHAHYSHQHP